MSETWTDAMDSEAYDAFGEGAYDSEAYGEGAYDSEAYGDASDEGLGEESRSARRRRERQRQILQERQRQRQRQRRRKCARNGQCRQNRRPTRAAGPSPRQTIAAVRDLDLDTKVELDSLRRELEESNRRASRATWATVAGVAAAEVINQFDALENHPNVSAAIPAPLCSCCRPRSKGAESKGILLDPRVIGGAAVLGIALASRFTSTSKAVRKILTSAPRATAKLSERRAAPSTGQPDCGSRMTGAEIRFSGRNLPGTAARTDQLTVPPGPGARNLLHRLNQGAERTPDGHHHGPGWRETDTGSPARQFRPDAECVVDPALWELLRAEAGTDGDRVVEAIIRLARPGIEIPDVRIVSRFGTVATCRIRARDVVAVRARPEVVSVKAARGLSPGFDPAGRDGRSRLGQASARPTSGATRPHADRGGRGGGLGGLGRGRGFGGVSLACRARERTRSAGGTRFLSFWDQRDQAPGPRPYPYGYGTVHDREEIDDALADPRPYERLGYHPAIADPAGRGTHGTHVLDIAAGNGEAGGPVGIAPGADLDLRPPGGSPHRRIANFGDSVRLLEAVDFISRTAGPRPCVINISAGRTCGPKDGTTLVERALDELLAATPGRFVVNSAGNYFGWRTHSCGRMGPGETRSLTFVVDPADITLNEIEIWYDGADEFAVRVTPPGYAQGRAVSLGERSDLLAEGRVIGRVYHRQHDPNNGDNHIVAYIDPVGCPGDWTVTLEARRVTTGRFHAWIERDDSCRGCQARFALEDSRPVTTIGTIASSRLPLIVGAYDGHDPARPIAPFSSSGPSRDLREKPDLAAPGVAVLAARSAPVRGRPQSRPACPQVRHQHGHPARDRRGGLVPGGGGRPAERRADPLAGPGQLRSGSGPGRAVAASAAGT